MSHTYPIIPIGHEETDRRLENVVNRIQRHCKIGKVTQKTVQRAQDSFDPFKKMSQQIPPAAIYNRLWVRGQITGA